jgi:hypothetical protein
MRSEIAIPIKNGRKRKKNDQPLNFLNFMADAFPLFPAPSCGNK